ncbi:MAG: hypothetical protein DDG59_04525 [Anaerolineae bacterium]|nr:MAG: hypothetical protein DDG59_04525 [Anaerolineae bacterium]
MEEPTVLDYVKSLLKDWRRLPTRLREITQPTAVESRVEEEMAEWSHQTSNATLTEATVQTGVTLSETTAARVTEKVESLASGMLSATPLAEPLQSKTQSFSRTARLAILSSLCGLILALFAQASLEPPNPNAPLGALLYAATAAVLLFASSKEYLVLPSRFGEDSLSPPTTLPKERGRELPSLADSDVGWDFRLHLPALGGAWLSGAIAFLAFGGGDFTPLNLLLWGIAIFFTVRAFYPLRLFRMEWLSRVAHWLQKPHWQVQITRWTIAVVLATLVVLFFRFYRLAEVPPEMVSDHAEKLLDVADVLDGKWHIFYPRNTGREAFQMFLTAAMAKLFGTGLSFMSLKLGTSIAGLITLVYLYLLGKELANPRVGLFAMTLAGVSYWLNVITRVGLRFSLYPLFVAPTLYYLIRALRRPNPKDFILCGFFLGLGLHGYSPFRVVPLVVLVAVGLALLHRATPTHRRAMLIGLMVIVMVSLIVFLPLLRYALQNPEMFFYRGLTRLTALEKPLDRPAAEIFFSNLWKALIMFFWNNGNVWVVSIPGRPALSVVSAALFFIGSWLVLVRYLRRFIWLDLFLLVSIPLLLLPSVLSLAFPDENPILNRTSGALIPVFLLAALGLEALIRPFGTALQRGWRQALAWLLAIGVLGLSIGQDYDLIFRQYYTQYAQSAWNTSQMGRIIHEFATTIGTPDTAWVVAYPYWVDTRLVGINAGYPLKDYAIWPDQLQETLAYEGAKLFIVKPEDAAGLETLQRLYPWGSWQEQRSPWEGKNFYLYFVPPGKTLPSEESTP